MNDISILNNNTNNWELLRDWIKYEVIKEYMEAFKNKDRHLEGIARGLDRVLIKMDSMDGGNSDDKKKI